MSERIHISPNGDWWLGNSPLSLPVSDELIEALGTASDARIQQLHDDANHMVAERNVKVWIDAVMKDEINSRRVSAPTHDDKMDLLEHLNLPVGNWYLPQDYDPKRSSCYDFQIEVEAAYGVKAGLAGIQGDHFCVIWLKPPEDYIYSSKSEDWDEVCYYVQPKWDEPSEDNEWKGEWRLGIHPQNE